jgi:hypothetical protein
MAFHGHQRRYELAYPPLVRAQHPAMGDMLTRGRGSACWTEDGLEEAILSALSSSSERRSCDWCHVTAHLPRL